MVLLKQGVAQVRGVWKLLLLAMEEEKKAVGQRPMRQDLVVKQTTLPNRHNNRPSRAHSGGMANLSREGGANRRGEIKRKRKRREREEEDRKRERRGEERKRGKRRERLYMLSIMHRQAWPGRANRPRGGSKTTRTCMKHYSTTEPTCRRSQGGMSHQRYCR